MPVQLNGQIFTDLDLLLDSIIRCQEDGISGVCRRYRLCQSRVSRITDIGHIAGGKNRCGQHADHRHQ